MIVIDTSALIAILNHEPERTRYFEIIAQANRRLISALAYQELGQILFSRRGAGGLHDLEDFISAIGAEIVPQSEELARFAIEAFKRYGKGIHPRARLNFRDCAAYALAKSLGLPLLFKGDDFIHTDVDSCL